VRAVHQLHTWLRRGKEPEGVPLNLLVEAILVDTDPSAGWAVALFGSTRAMRHESESVLEAELPPNLV